MGLPAIPGSTINSSQDLSVPEPHALAIMIASTAALLLRRHRSVYDPSIRLGRKMFPGL
ncbi:MAG TPA: PEP-CTERM sorting domain-containing protein [Tepidisphaeraceae bacterium]|jgi:hypothetical protein